ncbi:MAG: M3 family oligoendopeptidase [Bacillota bacterium]|nr:M3 family oligoendopeptidase [Bacillota bacterium]
MSLSNLSRTWDLDTFFPGGSASPEFAAYVDSLSADVDALSGEAGETPRSPAEWAAKLARVQGVVKRLRHASAFVSCLNAQNVHDRPARILGGRTSRINAAFASVLTRLDEQLLKVADAEWTSLLSGGELTDLAYVLGERRQRARDMLPPEQETLVNDLSVDGYHAWSNLYDLTTGRMTIEVEEDGRPVSISPGQLANRLSDADPAVRNHLMTKWEDAWAGEAESCALALNHLAGFRRALYAKRGWDSVLREPLEINRMKAETLQSMWDAIDASKDRLAAYLERKRRMLGLEQLGWQDVDAPVGETSAKLTYDEAANFVVTHFQKVSPRMAQLAGKAFQDRWIESEDRPGKRMGGFCTSFPDKRQSRIFVTFSGTLGNTATVAHELGHAYHQHVMNDLAPFNQQYAMNVAETASTFAEMVVADAALHSARTAEEKLVLLEDKLRRAATLLMNIQCRFLFETRFYEERAKGIVSVERLNSLMEGAQKDAFAGLLGRYHPHFWASKLHFYTTRVPFYNFPYTFGFLFSAGVYAKAMAGGPAFEDRYSALLRDTGRMRVEDLAGRHLDADLTTAGFWQGAIDLVLGDLDEFLRVTS